MSSSTHHVTIVTSNNNLDVPRTVRSRRASDTASIRSEAPPYTPSLHAAHTPQPPPRRSPHTAAGPSAAAPNDSNALAPTTALTSSSAATAPHGRTLSIEPPPYSPSTEDPPAYAPHPKPPQTPEAFTFRKFIHIMASALVTLDMFLCIFLVFVSGGMMLYSGIDHTIFPIAIPIMFAVTACFGRIGLTYENNSAVLFYIGIYSIRWLADAVAVLYLGRPFLGYGTGSLPSSSRGNNIPPPSPSSLPYPYPSPPAASNGPQFGFHMSLFAVSFTTILPGIRGVQPLIMPCYDNMRFTDDCPDVVMWNGMPLDFTPLLMLMVMLHLGCILIMTLDCLIFTMVDRRRGQLEELDRLNERLMSSQTASSSSSTHRSQQQPVHQVHHHHIHFDSHGHGMPMMLMSSGDALTTRASFRPRMFLPGTLLGDLELQERLAAAEASSRPQIAASPSGIRAARAARPESASTASTAATAPAALLTAAPATAAPADGSPDHPRLA